MPEPSECSRGVTLPPASRPFLSPRQLPYLWMLIGSFAFALMAAFAHAAKSHCDWPMVAIARSGLVLLFVGIMAYSARVPILAWQPTSLWLRSLAGSCSLVCTFYALPRLPVADTLTLTNTFPIWVAVLSWPMLGEWPNGRVWLAVLGGCLGVYLIQQPHLMDDAHAPAFAALCAAVFSAVAMLGLHRLKGLDPRTVIGHFSAVALVFSLMAQVGAGLPPMPGLVACALLLGVGVTATVGQYFLTKAFAAGSPSRVAVVGLTQIVFAMALDAVIWDRRFAMLSLLGIALVIGPTAWLLLERGSKR